MGQLHGSFKTVSWRSLPMSGNSDGYEAVWISQSMSRCCRLSGARQVNSVELSSFNLLQEAPKMEETGNRIKKDYDHLAAAIDAFFELHTCALHASPAPKVIETLHVPHSKFLEE